MIDNFKILGINRNRKITWESTVHARSILPVRMYFWIEKFQMNNLRKRSLNFGSLK
jgi:hypothetical protein